MRREEVHTKMKLLFCVVSCLFTASAVVGKPRSANILIVLDGFRHDYYGDEAFSTPNLDMLVKAGAMVRDVTPVFPSSYYPNIASILTGVYADRHNVLDTEVFSKETQSKLHSNDTEFWKSARDIGTIWVSILHRDNMTT
jgi:predicted AlkP superfamily pyrophosphatase or phosphodiesterase